MPKWTNTPLRSSSITILIFDQFSNLCLANLVEPLQAANLITRSNAFQVRIATLDGAAVHSSSGLQVMPHARLDDLRSGDTLFVLASYEHKRHDNRETRRALLAASRNARETVALDAAPWLLASAGLLDGRRATLHWDLIDAFSENFLSVDVERARMVRDGPFVTCAGVASAMDLSLDLIERNLGIAHRMDVEALYHREEHGADAWVENVADPVVSRALSKMRTNFEHPLSLSALAQALSCQPRTLDRRFRAELGASPGKVYRHLRLAGARSMLESRSLSIAEISVRCGYESPAALARAIRASYGVTPTQLRTGRHMRSIRSDEI